MVAQLAGQRIGIGCRNHHLPFGGVVAQQHVRLFPEWLQGGGKRRCIHVGKGFFQGLEKRFGIALLLAERIECGFGGGLDSFELHLRSHRKAHGWGAHSSHLFVRHFFFAVSTAHIHASTAPAFGGHHARLGLDLEFGIEFEGTSGNHALARFESTFDHVEISEAASQQDFPPFIGRLFLVGNLHIDNGALAGLQRGGHGDQQRGVSGAFVDIAERLGRNQRHTADIAASGAILDYFRMHRADPFSGEIGIHDVAVGGHGGPGNGADKHAGLKLQGRVFDNHAHLGGAGGGADDGVDEGNGSGEGFAGGGLGGEVDLAAVAQGVEIAFIGIELDPDGGKVGDGVDACAGFDIHAFLRVFMNYDARSGGIDGHVLRRGSALFDLGNLLGCKAPKAQFLAGGNDGFFGGFEQVCAV